MNTNFTIPFSAHKFHRWEQIVKNASKLSDYKYKLGAGIFKKGRLISVGYNTTKTHAKLQRYFVNATMHAECDAILHTINPDALKDAVIFVYRSNRSKGPAMAKPCPMCRRIIYESGIKTVYWSIPEFPYWDSASAEELVNEIVDLKKAYYTNRL